MIPEFCSNRVFYSAKLPEACPIAYSSITKILDKYGVSVVLISLGVIIILIVTLVKRIHKRRKARRVEKIKNTKTVTIDHSELDEELRRPPLS